MPDSGRDLLRAELSLALSQLGFEVVSPHPDSLLRPEHPDYLPRLLDKGPDLFLSVNLQGILPGGENTRALQDSGVKTVVWFVDNPWHILSGMRAPGWRSFTLAVTDHTFIAPLVHAGAKNVLHLPLAVSPEHMQAPENAGVLELRELVFVGRTYFPGRDSFFEGQEIPPEIMDTATGLLHDGFRQDASRPDFTWWTQQLGFSKLQDGFWPGKKSRKPGWGAAQCNALWRSACLKAAATSPGGLTLFGDSGWQQEFEALGIKADLRGPVDYYGSLPAIYSQAGFTVNLNSLLLPAGLSQRIFDVWAAGGFCLTDYSGGLGIFPEELLSPICFAAPHDLPELAADLKNRPEYKEELQNAWQEHILAEHTYRSRLEKLLEQIK